MKRLGDDTVVGATAEKVVASTAEVGKRPDSTAAAPHVWVRTDGGFQSDQLSGRRRNILTSFRHDLGDWPPCDYTEFGRTRDYDDIELIAHLDLDIFLSGAVTADSARVAIQWWTHPAHIGDRFTIHYAESSGYNCGWHKHENDHTDGLVHFQEQTEHGIDPTYEPIEFEQSSPSGILWEVIGERLQKRMVARIT